VVISPHVLDDLVPLRVPAGWAVVYNLFVELPPYDSISEEDARAFLSEDLLSIEAVRPDPAGGWRTDPDGAAIDLGWSAPGDVTGEYVLTVIVGTRDDPMASFRHRDRDLVRRAIDLTLATMLPGRPVDRMPPLFAELAREAGDRRSIDGGDVPDVPGDEARR
jgi:hypothetical protein